MLMDELFEFGETFNLWKKPDTKSYASAAAVYSSALKDIPYRYLKSAIESLKGSYRWSRMPLPADITNLLPAEYYDLRRTQMRLGLIEWKSKI